jgi:diadenylate cyclase
VLGYDTSVQDLCSGGFELSVAFSATRLRELAKMDGAIVLDADASTILRAAVQLVPDPSLPTGESGTRHRTAERMARQAGYPVISVSKSMRIIAVYTGGARYVLEDSTTILSRAHQALATLERYKLRLDQVTGALSALEIEDLVTVADITAVAQRVEMVRRIADEIEGHKIEPQRQFLAQDYVPAAPEDRARAAAAALAELAGLSADELLDSGSVAAVLGLGGPEHLDDPVRPHGYRLLATVPRLPGPAADALIASFGSLQKLLAASVTDLQQVAGVGSAQARSIREGLSRLAESSLLERYS